MRRAKEHIRAGDAFQIVLSQRAERPTAVSALALYRSLRRINPSPYHFLLELGDVSLVGSSPETLVKLDGTRASVNPIAGTTAPGDDDEAELLASEKDRAEHVMLVDLGPQRPLAGLPAGHGARRPLPRGRALLARHPPRLRGGRRASPRDTAPSTSCAPASLPVRSRAPRRCARCRSSPSSRATAAARTRARSATRFPEAPFDTCIAIRTVVLADGLARLQAGAGIVADSDPAAEHEECLRKLAALEQALEEADA